MLTSLRPLRKDGSEALRPEWRKDGDARREWLRQTHTSDLSELCELIRRLRRVWAKSPKPSASSREQGEQGRKAEGNQIENLSGSQEQGKQPTPSGTRVTIAHGTQAEAVSRGEASSSRREGGSSREEDSANRGESGAHAARLHEAPNTQRKRTIVDVERSGEDPRRKAGDGAFHDIDDSSSSVLEVGIHTSGEAAVAAVTASDHSDDDCVIISETPGGSGAPSRKRRRLVKGQRGKRKSGEPGKPMASASDRAAVRDDLPSPWRDLSYVEGVVGRRIKLFWGGDRRWFNGRITRANPKTHTVRM